MQPTHLLVRRKPHPTAIGVVLEKAQTFVESTCNHQPGADPQSDCISWIVQNPKGSEHQDANLTSSTIRTKNHGMVVNIVQIFQIASVGESIVVESTVLSRRRSTVSLSVKMKSLMQSLPQAGSKMHLGYVYK